MMIDRSSVAGHGDAVRGFGHNLMAPVLGADFHSGHDRAGEYSHLEEVGGRLSNEF